jgi:hypothetical protein
VADYKVYISSTYRDLAPYRKAVAEALHTFPNFKVISMEYYVAESKQPLDKCLEDVASCDIYLLILAKRYGYVSPGTSLSITHQEFRQARLCGKTILVFKADSRVASLLPDSDEDGPPTALEKAASMQGFVREVSSEFLSHVDGFTAEYHLTTQVLQALMRHLKVDFNIVLDDEQKILCDRSTAVMDFYGLAAEKQPFNLFLLRGKRADLPESLVFRLSKHCLHVRKEELVNVSYYEFFADGLYAKFRQRLLHLLSTHLLLPNQATPTDSSQLLAAVKAQGTSTLVLHSSVSEAVQWEQGRSFLNDFLQELAAASKAVGGISVYWFLISDMETDPEYGFAVGMATTPPLRQVRIDDIDKWLNDCVVDDEGIRETLLENYFSEVYDLKYFAMSKAQEQILKFIRMYNKRRTEKGDKKLLELLP